MKRSREHEGYREVTIYAIIGEITGRVKIGFTDGSSGTVRLHALQIGSPDRLIHIGDSPGGRRVEALIHEALNAQNVHGEWFDEDVAVAVKQACESGKFDEWINSLLSLHVGDSGRRSAERAPIRCGTDAGYQKHLMRHEQPCEPCRQAHRYRQCGKSVKS